MTHRKSLGPLAVIALGISSCCLRPVSEGGDGGVPPPAGCLLDSDCNGSAYCARTFVPCDPGNGTDGTAAPGSCHRSCWNGACACADDADCPGGVCGDQTPLGGASCRVIPIVLCPDPSCDPACPSTHLGGQDCSVCLCDRCPAPDGGLGIPGCRSDQDCPQGVLPEYCDLGVTVCPATDCLNCANSDVLEPGVCRTFSTGGIATCASNADCAPDMACDGGTCLPFGCQSWDPPGPSCPPGCAWGPVPHACPECLCAACIAPAGDCGPQTCADGVCCPIDGGVACVAAGSACP